jgi:hypothetical protein
MYLRDKGKGHENRKCMKMVQGRAVCFGGGGGVAAAAATGKRRKDLFYFSFQDRQYVTKVHSYFTGIS